MFTGQLQAIVLVATLIAGLLILAWISLLGHVAAHLAAAWATGMWVSDVHIGDGKRSLSFTIRETRCSCRFIPTKSLIFAYPRTVRGYSWRQALFFFAGPCVSLAILIALFGYTYWGWGVPSNFSHRNLASQNVEPALHLAILGAGLSLILWMAFEFALLCASVVPHGKAVGSRRLAASGSRLWRLMWGKVSVPHEPQILLDTGRATRALQAGQNNEAVAHLREAIRLAGLPHGVQLQNLLANTFASMGKFAEAEVLYREVTNVIPPDDPERVHAIDAFASYALFQNQRHLFVECEAMVRKTLEHWSDQLTLKGTLGSLLVEMGKFEEGQALLEELQLKPTSEEDAAISAAYLSILAKLNGDADCAVRLAKEARERLPSHPLILRLLGA